MSDNSTKNRETHGLGEDTGQSCGNLLEDVAWLAGVIDGEGYLCIDQFMNKNRLPTGSPKLIISNCNEALSKKAAWIIYQITHKMPKIYFSERLEERHHGIWRVRINAQKELRKVCEATLPHLTAKRKQAEILIQFCVLRKGKKHLGKRPYGSSTYGEKEFGLMAAMKEAAAETYGPSEGAASTERTALVN